MRSVGDGNKRRVFKDVVLGIYINHIAEALRLHQSVNSTLGFERGYCFQKSDRLDGAACPRQ